jgi:hypothetical protein
MTGDALRKTKLILSSAAVLLGIASIVSTFTSGGGITSVGVFLGAVLIAMGSIRIYLTLRHDF